LHVPSGAKPAYLASEDWKDFNIVEDANETGIADVSLSNFAIYPNPTNDEFIVECDGILSIKLYDILGKEVVNQNINGKSEINISHLPKGVYNVRVISKDRTIGNNKIVKQ
jgi:hypothetical protein